MSKNFIQFLNVRKRTNLSAAGLNDCPTTVALRKVLTLLHDHKKSI